MAAVRIQIVRIVHEHQPNIVECRLTDAWGQEWTFSDKSSVFTSDDLEMESFSPVPGVVRCQVVKREQDAQGREVIIIDTEKPDYVEAIGGNTQFAVLSRQLVEINTAWFA